MKMAVACALLTVGFVAVAADYPTSPNDRDELCEEIGGSGKSSAAPADLLWFSQNCVCDDDVGCGYTSSQRFASRRDKLAKEEARRQDAERQAAAKRDAEAQKEARDSCGDWVACLRKPGNGAGACAPEETRFEFDCSSGLRDVDACGTVIEGLRRNPAQADCAGALTGAVRETR